MTIALNPDRRGLLFEMLRRQNMSQTAQKRMSAQEQEELEENEARNFLAAALRSWNHPGDDEADAAVAARTSAPEARGNHEFLRAVGA